LPKISGRKITNGLIRSNAISLVIEDPECPLSWCMLLAPAKRFVSRVNEAAIAGID